MSVATKSAARLKTYSPSEFAAALADSGIPRSERWVQEHCKAGHIRTALNLPGRYLIPASELARLVKSEAA